MRKLIYLFVVLAVVLFSTCAVTIPAIDRTAPTFIFEITNGLPGGTMRITSADDLSRKQLNLRRNTLYRFRFSGSDAGGLGGMKLRVNWPTNYDGLSIPRDQYIIVSDDTFYRELSWLGDRSNPLSGYLITGQLNTIMYNQSYAIVSVEWELSASDFGGTSGTANTTSKVLKVGIVDETQEIGLLDL